jgi:hypothetical protein
VAPHTVIQEKEALRRVRALARLMDEAVGIPGTRFRLGLDSLLGLFPVIGDFATALISGYIIREAVRLGAPPQLVARMLVNVGIDFVTGSVPLVGDIFDAVWKANKMNVALLEAFVQARNRPQPKTYIDV